MSGQRRGGMIKQGRSSLASLIVRLSGNGKGNALQAAGSFSDQQGFAHAAAGYAKTLRNAAASSLMWQQSL